MFVAFTAAALAGSLAELDAMTGYGGLEWGTAPAERMVTPDAVPDLQGIRSYTRPDEPLVAGPFALRRRWYDYCFGRLCRVQIVFGTRAPATELVDALTARYGAPERGVDLEVRIWRGEKVELVCDFEGRLLKEAFDVAGRSDDAAATCWYTYLPIAAPRLPNPGL